MRRGQVFLIVFFALLCREATSAKDDGDEGRPYEFGFTIDGEQHRHESRDVNGIIQGEFGFITADGIYHTTVYATDENGKFKILSMRSVRVSAPLDQLDGPIPSHSAQKINTPAIPSSPKFPTVTPAPPRIPQVPAVPPPSPIVHSPASTVFKPPPPQPQAPPPQPQAPFPKPQAPLQTPPPKGPPVQPLASTTKAPFVFTTKPTIKPACGGCGLPLPSTIKPEPLPFQTPEFQNPPSSQPVGIPQPQQPAILPPSTDLLPPSAPIGGPVGITNPAPSPIGQVPVRPAFPGVFPSAGVRPPAPPTSGGFVNSQAPIGQRPQHSQDLGLLGNPVQEPGNALAPPAVSFNVPSPIGQAPGRPSAPPVGTSNALQFPNPAVVNSPQENLNQVSVQMGIITIPNNPPIPIIDKYPGMVDGLPEGVTEQNVLDLLYKFNYTVGFHGHYEKGLRNGAKIGGYFVNGRDGISRVVTYVADENGYRPKFKLINLGLDSPDTPKPETEKTFGLRNFEFVWYPVK